MKQNECHWCWSLATWNVFPYKHSFKKKMKLHNDLCNLYNSNVSVCSCDMHLYISQMFPLFFFYCWMYNCFVLDMLSFPMWHLPCRSWFSWVSFVVFLTALICERSHLQKLLVILSSYHCNSCLVFCCFQFAYKNVWKIAHCLQIYTVNICIY